MSRRIMRVTILADEWKSSKGGLSTMNRELAIQLAKHPNLAVTFFVPKCTDADKKAASRHNISIVEAQEWPGFESVDRLCFPPKDLAIDILIGHGVKLGKQAQAIKYYHHCKWVQVVHTAPEKLAMFKTYHGAISKGNKKQWTEVKLCKIADRVVAVGPKLHDIYSRYLSGTDKNVFKLTPGIFTELSDLKTANQESKEFWVLVFGRGDSEDFELKGFDIAAKAVTNLKDESYHLIFVGATCGNEEEVAEKLLEQGLNRNQLTVKEYLEDRDDLATLLSTANLAVMPSRTEGFGLTGLEALSAGLPFLVSKNSGFGEALQEIPSGSSWIVDSEDPVQWAEAIKGVREKGREEALKECQELRTRYAEKYSWEKQCNGLVEMMAPLVDVSEQKVKPAAVLTPLQNRSQTANEKSERNVEKEQLIASTSKGEMGKAVSFEDRPEQLTGVLKDELETLSLGSVSQPEGKRVNDKAVRTSRQKSPLQEDQPATEQRREGENVVNVMGGSQKRKDQIDPSSSHTFSENPNLSTTGRTSGNMESLCSEQETRSKETLFARTGRTKLKDLAILGCNVSENSIQAVRQIFRDIGPRLKLGCIPTVENYLPSEVKQYLTTNHLKFCVLAVDAETVKAAYENLPLRENEYVDLLKTAANLVDEKVVILICDSFSFISKAEIIGRTIERVFSERGNGVVAWLKNGKLSVQPDVVLQFLASAAPHPIPEPRVQDTTGRAPVSTSGYSYQPQGDPLQRNHSVWETGHGWNVPNVQRPVPQAAATIHQRNPPERETGHGCNVQ